jgi:hypothetical protein
MVQKVAASQSTNGEALSSVSRRGLLRGAAIAAGGAVALAATPAEARLTQKAAGYQDKPDGGKSCVNCALFKPPSSCSLVDGAINPNGYCRFYMRK